MRSRNRKTDFRKK